MFEACETLRGFRLQKTLNFELRNRALQSPDAVLPRVLWVSSSQFGHEPSGVLREELNALRIAISAEDMLVQGIATILLAENESAVLTLVAIDMERSI